MRGTHACLTGCQLSIFFAVEEKQRQALENIIDTKAKVISEIALLKEKLKLARETIAKFKTEMSKVQGQQAAA